MESYICKFNQFGFCKFQEKCKRNHNNFICENNKCSILECEMRHPKPCRFFHIYKRCEFGTYCRHSHIEEEKDKCIKTLTSEIETLEKDIKRQSDEIDLMKEKIYSLEN